MSNSSDPRLHVLYNASCPICSREIDHYAALSTTQSLPLAFDDLNEPDTLKRWGLSREVAAKRLHVRREGVVISGLPAFIAIWREIPRYTWLARVVGAPVIRTAAGAVYDMVLAPLLWRSDRMRMRRNGCDSGTCAPEK
ncbi:thiol-disulfide oxidoreductase DCC family protein [Roseobacter ponti]|uniref:DUF393 domain-containing protein n=1 Tax=Roseobacter ponti TaxID=1891787 RepID=A0A858SVV4_9RHOB|nr:DUF393 domain-containing protein [Roseobacter ponti]QJF52410.1 DUF393 domain-containing protein [Roseobacter ponti]